MTAIFNKQLIVILQKLSHLKKENKQHKLWLGIQIVIFFWRKLQHGKKRYRYKNGDTQFLSQFH